MLEPMEDSGHERARQGGATPTSENRRTILIIGLSLFSVVTLLALTLRTAQSRSKDCPKCELNQDYDAEPTQDDAEEVQEKLGMGLAFFIMTLCACVLGSYFMSLSSFTTLPDCIVYVFAGISVGTVLRLLGRADAAGYALPNQQQFFLFVVPPIIFEAGYSLNQESFFEQSGPILLFAVVGTTITALVFGGLIFAVGVVGLTYYFSFYEALTFGALLSAVDPVATIAIFNAMKVNKTLHYLVLGESVLNDAVAIVLYRTFADMIGPDKPEWYLPILTFLYIFIGSVVVGALTSCLSAAILKSTDLRNTPTLELSFYILTGFLPYFVCEGLQMSGIMGILSGAMFLSHYAKPNLSQTGQTTSKQLFKALSYMAEAFVFIYLGFALTSFNHIWDSLTVVFSILFTLTSRWANIYPLSFAINRYRRSSNGITAKTQFIMWFSGLRGAIAFALSLNFPGGNEDTRRVVISTTLAIVLFTIIVLGGGTLPILQLLRVEGAETIVRSTSASKVATEQPEEGALPSDEQNPSWIRRVDNLVLKPLLVRQDPAPPESTTPLPLSAAASPSAPFLEEEHVDIADGPV